RLTQTAECLFFVREAHPSSPTPSGWAGAQEGEKDKIFALIIKQAPSNVLYEKKNGRGGGGGREKGNIRKKEHIF
ncbi:hypothetical protein, partial [Staphylococcus pseudintermedius]|uniref:hypothetical protein n=1 Tax=Staphylococcus pseudintermedius TaxID=283734 RepID=UPI0010EF98D1